MPLNNRRQMHNKKIDAKLHAQEAQIQDLKGQVAQLMQELSEKNARTEELEMNIETLHERIILMKEIIHSLYQIGDKVVYPMHGAGVIDSIVEKDVCGSVKEYYIMRMPSTDMVVMIPTATSDIIGVRPVVQPEEAEAVINSISDIVTNMTANWNKRYRENMTKIKSGNLMQVAEVIKISQEPVSLETPVGEEDDSNLGDFIKDSETKEPAESASYNLLREQLSQVMATLTPREAKVLRLRFGLEDGRPHTLEEVGKEFDVTRERVRQIESKALRKLRHQLGICGYGTLRQLWEEGDKQRISEEVMFCLNITPIDVNCVAESLKGKE